MVNNKLIKDIHKFNKKCPVCKNPMANGNFYCSLQCYNIANKKDNDKK